MKNIKCIYPIVLIGVLTATPPVWAHRPEQRQMAHIEALARQLDDAAHHVHVAAERTGHQNTPEEAYALRKLHQLDNRASQFEREVRRRYHNPRRTEADFEWVKNTFREAKYAFRYLHAFRHVRSDLDQVERLVFRLDDYYGGPTHRLGSHRHSYHWYPERHGK
jgi:aminoglycoside phosphotransferase